VDERARALDQAAKEARKVSDFLSLERIGREMIAHGEASEDREARAWGNYHTGIACNVLNRGAEAERATRAALELFDEIGDELAAARVKLNLAAIEIDNNVDAAEARRLYEEGAPVIRASGDSARLAIALGNLGEICRLEGDYRGALQNGAESLELFRALHDVERMTWLLVDLAHYHSLLRDEPASLARMREAYDLIREHRNPRWIAWYFDTWVILAAKLDRWEEVAQLLAFTDRYRDEQNQPRLQSMLPWFSAPRERLGRELAHERLEELFDEGEALTLERAQALAETLAPNDG
jgi:tetratricopeptide (TPR) repeat protein